MVINGKKVSGANELTIVIPRHNSADHAFKFRSFRDYDAFHSLVKEPQAPEVYRGALPERDLTDAQYLLAQRDYVTKFDWFIFLYSLQAGSPDIVFESVSLTDPSTWGNAVDEMLEAGFTRYEIRMLREAANEVNGLDAEKIKDATQSFLLGQGRGKSLNPSLPAEQPNTESGAPVNDSESDHPE